MAMAIAPAGASATLPTLEFVAPGHSLPVRFTTESGAVSAEMAGFETLVHCTASQGEGEITGPRSTVSKYRLTGCTAGSQKCKSAGANEEEIKTGEIDGDLVYIDQAKRQVGILLNPGGDTYISFECGGESAEGQGAFVAPVSPIDQEATSFTATLSQLSSVQTPDEYENEKGELRQAIPTGRRGSNEFVPTGVELAMTVHPSVPVEIKAVTTQEIEANQYEEEAEEYEEVFKQLQASLAKQEEALKMAEEHAKRVGEEAKKHEEEAIVRAAAEAKKHQEEEATARSAAEAKKRQEEEAAAKKKREETEKAKSKRSLARALRECQRRPKSRRARCLAVARKKYGGRR
jgi:hypothetical protein